MPKTNRIWFYIVGCIIFCISNTQEILFHSNQNTKFLHGIANSGYGFLENDWLSNTWDPLFVFTGIVTLTYTHLGTIFFYIYYYLLLSIYFIFVVKIIINVFHFRLFSYQMISFVSVFIFIHSEFLHQVSTEIIGQSIRNFLTFGFAYQYIFNNYFQPSVFGVFIVVSLYFFLDRRYYIAVIFSSASMVFHSAYFMHAALLTLMYMTYTFIEKGNIKKPIYLGSLSLVIVLPVVLNSLQHFDNSLPQLQGQAREIVINYIIPFHSIPKEWFSAGEIFKTVLTIIAIYLLRNHRIGIVLLVFFSIASFFIVMDVAYPNNTIRFMAPWRLSVIFYPVSILLLLGFLIKWLSQFHIFKTLTTWISIFIIIVSLVSGILFQIDITKNYRNRTFSSMMDYVKENKRQKDIYFIPPYIADFRLYTGASVFITSKSHPYRSDEILEWYHREQIAKQFYDKETIDEPYIYRLINTYGITHIVLHENQKIKNSRNHLIKLEKQYDDATYIIYKVQKAEDI